MHPSFQSTFIAKKLEHTLTDLLKELKEDPESVELFEQFHPEFWNDLAEQGYQCLELDQIPQAHAIFDFLLHYFPDEAAYQAAFADILNGLKQYIASCQHYQKTISLSPDVPDAYYHLAENFMILRYPQYALPCLEKASELTHNEAHPLDEETKSRKEFARTACQTKGIPKQTLEGSLEKIMSLGTSSLQNLNAEGI